MKNPLVSVVIPTHGGAEFLPRAVDSVLAQTYQNIEVIVVDDNGLGTEIQKQTAKAIEPYLQNPKVQYVCHEVNKNGSAARNTGARHAKGDFIALLDDDDYFYPDNIENHMKAWEYLDDSYGLTFCNAEVEYQEGVKTIRHSSLRGQDLYSTLLHRITITSSSMVVKKTAWEALHGFDESFRRHQDFEFSARIMANYNVWATQTIGEFSKRINRHSPKDIPMAIEYRLHYLEKMNPIMISLPYYQQKLVKAFNLVEVAWPYYQNMQYGNFFKVLTENHILVWSLWPITRNLLKIWYLRIKN